jgi:uncharacterized protein with GYD domain
LEDEMPKYLWQVFYTSQGVQGLRKDGGVARRAAVKRLIEQAGGKLRTVPLVTPEEMDTATKKSIDYQPPGSAGR